MKALATLGFAAGLGIITCQSAAALPAAPDAIQQMATASTAVQRAQYAERRKKASPNAIAISSSALTAVTPIETGSVTISLISMPIAAA